MKQVINKTLAVFMAFVVLMTTMSFSVEMHFCGDTLVDTSLFNKVDGCGMEMNKSLTEGCSISKKNCCDEEKMFVGGQDELRVSVDKISQQQQTFLASFIYSYIQLLEGYDENIFSFEEYKPPLVIRQLYKIDESYLI
tara:strand:- start:5164 stop:5577 length:414 start_codon:yes stop_codon:yes gene_type:complete